MCEPISGRGEPYTREIYERAQAEKLPYDQPHPIFRNNDALGFCARLVAILESASGRKDYHMCVYKVHTALDSLQREFGMDEKLYQHSGPHSVNNDNGGCSIEAGLGARRRAAALDQAIGAPQT